MKGRAGPRLSGAHQGRAGSWPRFLKACKCPLGSLPKGIRGKKALGRHAARGTAIRIHRRGAENAEERRR